LHLKLQGGRLDGEVAFGKGGRQVDSARRTAVVVGVLFLSALTTNLIGSKLVESIIYAPDYLVSAYPNRIQVTAGLLLELIAALAVVGIPVMMFPILRKDSETIALGYLALRVIESATVFVGNAGPRSLLTLSQEYVRAGAPEAPYFQTLGALFQAERYWAYPMLGVVFSFGALLFYYSLFRSRLIPRFISGWGLAGAVLLLIGLVVGMFGSSAGVMVFAAPIALNELFLAIWLIVKGFSGSAAITESAGQT
jgi:uncharacterized membrane protein YecN with MAPEG domain